MLPQSLISVLSNISSASGGHLIAGTSSQTNSQLQSIERLLQQTSALNSQSASASSANTSGQSQVTGADSNQITQTAVNSTGSKDGLSLQGNVIQAASAASLTVVGGSGSVLTSGGLYSLTGNSGSVSLNLTQGESLDSVASLVNQYSSKTGVIAAVTGNNLVLTSKIIGSNSAVSLTPLNAASSSVSGLTSGQVNSVNVVSQTPGSSDVISGSVLSSATKAGLVYNGNADGTVSSAATFQLTGAVGSTQVTFTQGESLSAAANAINQESSTTGVVATVNGAQLSLNSSTTGASETVQVSSVQTPQILSTTGVNSSQVSGFNVESIGDNSSQAISGQVLQSASQAALTLQGTSSGNVQGNATFQLTGALGSTQLSIVQGQSLTSVADEVNAQSSSTGVVANVVGTNLVFESSGVGSAANISIQNVDHTYSTVVSGVNSQQFSTFNTNSIGTGDSDSLSGNIVQSATQATATLAGSSTGTVVDSATFQLSGSLGATNISITQGQSLSSVATQVNAQTSATGVTATVVGNNLLFASTGVGSAASVGVQLTNITHTTVVSGVNSQQLSSFQTNSITTGASDTLSGNVSQSATQATLTLQGSASGTVVDTATFQLTGALGSTNFSITKGQSLSSVASAINAQTTTTGVQANVVGTNLVFNSTAVGSAANVAINLKNITYSTVISGTNSQQISSFQANSVTQGASDTLSGQITQTATQAQVTLQGSTSGTVQSSATFKLSGSLGSQNVSITQGQSLSSVASTINGLTSSTGVQATVSGNTLVFSSTGVGSSANVGVQLTNLTYTNTATGANAHQISSFQINSLTNGSSETLSGTVTQAASAASLTFTGSLGFVGTSSTFTLRGSTGSTQISTTGLESLSTLVSTINAATSTTGVTAALSGNTVTLKSSTVGSSATVGVSVTSGSFGVSGGNGNGTATGTNAVATINGTSVTGNGNSFQYTDSLGSYSFNVFSGFTGSFSPITVSSQGSFSLSGGNGNGTATGGNAVAVINGQTITGNGDSFQYSDSTGSYSFASASGYTGTFNPITVASQAGQFNVTGGNGNGSANGTNAVATINGQTITGTGNNFQYTDGTGSYSFTTASGFTGTLNSVSVASQAGQFQVTTSNGNGTSNGTNAVATINGQTITGTGNSFNYSDADGSYSFTTAAGYTGAFNTVNVASQASAFNLTGGNGNGTANGSDAIAVINGQTLTGSGNTFQYSNGSNNFEISFNSGFQGSFSPITAQSEAGTFNLQGGNGDGTANGTNLVAIINGAEQASSNNQLTVAGDNGIYTLSFANGFVGQFNPITVTGENPVTTTGGDASGVAHGTDAVANINGSLITGVGGQITYSQNGVNVSLNFAPGFQGSFNPVSVNQSSSNGAQNSSDSSSTTSSSANQNSPLSGSSSGWTNEAVQVIQNETKQNLILSQFNGLINLFNQLQNLESTSSSSSPSEDSQNSTNTDSNDGALHSSHSTNGGASGQPADSATISSFQSQKNNGPISVLA